MEVPNGGTIESKKVPRYSLDFKLKAVELTQIPGMEVQAGP